MRQSFLLGVWYGPVGYPSPLCLGGMVINPTQHLRGGFPSLTYLPPRGRVLLGVPSG